MSYRAQNKILGIGGKRVVTAGSFGVGVTAVAASHSATWTKKSGGNSQFDAGAQAAIVGDGGNSYDFALTDGGGPACAGTFAATHYDATLAVRSGEAGWVVSLQPHAVSGLGIVLQENATAKSLVVLYETGASTRAAINAAINAAGSNIYVLYAGSATGALTAAADGFASVALSDSPATVAISDGTTHVECYYTDSTSTVGDAKAALAANPAATALMTFSGGTDATVLVTADHFVATALTGGVNAVAISNIRGKGYSVSKTGTGAYTVTLDDTYGAHLMVASSLQLAAADDKFVVVGSISGSSFTLVIWDKSGAGPADVTVDANNRINFIVYSVDSTIS